MMNSTAITINPNTFANFSTIDGICNQLMELDTTTAQLALCMAIDSVAFAHKIPADVLVDRLSNLVKAVNKEEGAYRPDL